RDASILQIVVAYDGELCFLIPLYILVGNLARLYEGTKSFLPIFEPHSDVGRAFHAPEEIEVIPIALVSIGARNGPVEAIGPLETQGGFRDPGRGAIRIAREG